MKKSNHVIIVLLVISFFLTPSMVMANSTSWSMQGGNAAGNFYVPISTGIELSILHPSLVAGSIPKALEGDILYTMEDENGAKLFAVDLKDNTLIWEFTTENNSSIKDVVSSGNMVYVLTSKKIYAIENVQKGFIIKWTLKDPSEEFSALTINKGYVFYASTVNGPESPQGMVKAVDAVTGDAFWEFELDENYVAPKSLTAGGFSVYFLSYNPVLNWTKLYAIDDGWGSLHFSRVFFSELTTSEHLIFAGSIYWGITPPEGSPHIISVGRFHTEVRTHYQYLDNPFIFINGIGAIGIGEAIHLMDDQGYLYSISRDWRPKINWKVPYADSLSSGEIINSTAPFIITRDHVILENNSKIKFFDIDTGLLQKEYSFPGRNFSHLQLGGSRLIAADSKGITVFTIGNLPPSALPRGEFVIYTVQKGDTLNLIAQKYNTTAKHIAEINYLSNPNMIEVGQSLKVARINNPLPSNLDIYVVQRGDTLAEIAKKHGTDLNFILAVNHLPDPNMLWVGQEIRIPKQYTTPIEPPKEEVPIEAPKEQPEYWVDSYTVKVGDTLGKIAKLYSTTIDHLVQLNRLDNPNMIFVNHSLKVPNWDMSKKPIIPTIEYVVRAGDTLGKIAFKYQISLFELVELNQIANPNNIYIGQTILIPIENNTPAREGKTHIVKTGDTIWLVSQQYGVTMDSIINNNNLSNPNLLFVGQSLIIK